MKSKKEVIKSLAINKKDKHSFRGLTKSVNQRKRLLAYLSKNDPKKYSDVLKKLNLRK